MTDPMTLTERVARAICAAQHNDWTAADVNERRGWKIDAQAAITAIEASGTHVVIDRAKAMHMLNIMPRTRVVEQLTAMIAACVEVTE